MIERLKGLEARIENLVAQLKIVYEPKMYEQLQKLSKQYYKLSGRYYQCKEYQTGD